MRVVVGLLDQTQLLPLGLVQTGLHTVHKTQKHQDLKSELQQTTQLHNKDHVYYHYYNDYLKKEVT